MSASACPCGGASNDFQAAAPWSARYFGTSRSAQGPFRLLAGKYQFAGVATSWTGQTATLQTLGPDGATYVPVANGLTANSVADVDIPEGQYEVTLGTGAATQAVSVSVVRIGAGGSN